MRLIYDHTVVKSNDQIEVKTIIWIQIPLKTNTAQQNQRINHENNLKIEWWIDGGYLLPSFYSIWVVNKWLLPIVVWKLEQSKVLIKLNTIVCEKKLVKENRAFWKRQCPLVYTCGEKKKIHNITPKSAGWIIHLLSSSQQNAKFNVSVGIKYLNSGRVFIYLNMIFDVLYLNGYYCFLVFGLI